MKAWMMTKRRKTTSKNIVNKRQHKAILCLSSVAATWSWIFSSGIFSERLVFFFSLHPPGRPFPSQLSSFAALTQKVTSAGFKRERGFYSSARVLGSPKTGESLELFAGQGCSLFDICCSTSILCRISTKSVGNSPTPRLHSCQPSTWPYSCHLLSSLDGFWWPKICSSHFHRWCFSVFY